MIYQKIVQIIIMMRYCGICTIIIWYKVLFRKIYCRQSAVSICVSEADIKIFDSIICAAVVYNIDVNRCLGAVRGNIIAYSIKWCYLYLYAPAKAVGKWCCTLILRLLYHKLHCRLPNHHA